jgi:hypothetical protein
VLHVSQSSGYFANRVPLRLAKAIAPEASNGFPSILDVALRRECEHDPTDAPEVPHPIPVAREEFFDDLCQ